MSEREVLMDGTHRGRSFAALVATLLEAISPYGMDNLTVLVVVAIVLFWLGL